jgi:hypothetical protein
MWVPSRMHAQRIEKLEASAKRPDLSHLGGLLYGVFCPTGTSMDPGDECSRLHPVEPKDDLFRDGERLRGGEDVGGGVVSDKHQPLSGAHLLSAANRKGMAV